MKRSIKVLMLVFFLLALTTACTKMPVKVVGHINSIESTPYEGIVTINVGIEKAIRLDEDDKVSETFVSPIIKTEVLFALIEDAKVNDKIELICKYNGFLEVIDSSCFVFPIQPNDD
jgi:hypothetical protein